MDELIAQPIAAIAAAIKAKQITSVDLVKNFLDRIDSVNGALNAVVTLNTDNALKYAAKADADLANGEHHGPLHGIPMTIKDS
ncbi:MAG: Asp-tRNA(Asn)/Glu-tRNA(Gln) amidotransferase A subunit family amidase, partial [Sulfitobacter sp.]